MTPLDLVPPAVLALVAGGVVAVFMAATGGPRGSGRPFAGPDELRPALLRVRSDNGTAGAAVGVRRRR
jgi:hypothetical protein